MASKDDNNKKENENQDNITNNRENQYDNNKYSDVVDRDLKERLCYMFKSCNLVRHWDTVLDELILHTYPDLTPKQRYLYKEIIQTIWDLEFSTAPYDEVVIRIYVPEKNNPTNNPFLNMKPEKALDSDAADFREKTDELFEKGEDKEVEDVVNELCKKGIITSKMTTFKTYKKDGTLKSSTPARILVMRDADRENAIQAMAEVFNSIFTAYFPDVPRSSEL
jgi:hypothetical protein